MFPTMDRFGADFLALVALGAAALGRPTRATGQADVWRPRTVPLYGVSYAPDIGFQLGAGLVHTRYGFRALPASTRLIVTAEYAAGAERLRVRADGEFRRPLAPAILSVEALASGLELIRFYGFGNTSDTSQPDSVYRVRQRQFLLAPTVWVPLAPRVRLALGPLARYSSTHSDPGTVLGSSGPYYGAGDFGEVGLRLVLELDTRDAPAAPASGACLGLAATACPAAWDVIESCGSVSAEASTYLSLGDAAPATLALRAGGATVRGTAPFTEAVYVGGGTTVRGYAEQRFAGRSGAYANAELRVAVARLSAGDAGVFGLADGGRVSAAGARTSGWPMPGSRASSSRSPSAAPRTATRRTGWRSSPGPGSSGMRWCSRRSSGDGPGSSASREAPARWARRRCRTSARTVRRSRTPSCRCGAWSATVWARSCSRATNANSCTAAAASKGATATATSSSTCPCACGSTRSRRPGTRSWHRRWSD